MNPASPQVISCTTVVQHQSQEADTGGWYDLRSFFKFDQFYPHCVCCVCVCVCVCVQIYANLSYMQISITTSDTKLHNSSITQGSLVLLLHSHSQPPLPPSLCVYVLSHSLVSDSLRPHGLQPARLFCLWNCPGKNTGVGCHFLLQGICPIHGLKAHLLGLLHWQADSLPLCHLGSPLRL